MGRGRQAMAFIISTERSADIGKERRQRKGGRKEEKESEFTLTASKALLYSANFSWLKMQHLPKSRPQESTQHNKSRKQPTKGLLCCPPSSSLIIFPSHKGCSARKGHSLGVLQCPPR